MGEKKHGLRRMAGYFVNHRLLNWMPDKPYLQFFIMQSLESLLILRIRRHSTKN